MRRRWRRRRRLKSLGRKYFLFFSFFFMDMMIGGVIDVFCLGRCLPMSVLFVRVCLVWLSTLSMAHFLHIQFCLNLKKNKSPKTPKQTRTDQSVRLLIF